MTDPDVTTSVPLDSIQPGGGACMRLELAWGAVRRWYLKRFRAGYVERMRRLRQRTPEGCPHEVLDPRDLKFYRNRTGDCWRPEDDPFAWRDRLPVARVGLAEILILGGGCLVLAAALSVIFWPLALVAAVAALFVIAFFRNPRRRIPSGPGVVVAPADGLVVGIERLAHDPWIDGPAVQLDIFLSVFDVHINRVPMRSQVVGVEYRPGKFLNALRPRSARENERVTLRLEEAEPPHRRLVVRQIAGAIARRIVCCAYLGEQFDTGAVFGMIKFGSRTELVMPDEPGMVLQVRMGQRVRAGATVVAQYLPVTSEQAHDAQAGSNAAGG